MGGDDFVTGGTDAWRYDETVLDDLEDFLNKVEGSEEKAAPAEADPQALKLLEEVRFELAEARGEVAQLTTENRLMTNRLDGSGVSRARCSWSLFYMSGGEGY